MKNIIIGSKFFILMTILLGLVYPLFIILVGQSFFYNNSNGRTDLIGQKFDQDKYFWGRLSAIDYNSMPSGGSNLSLTSKALHDRIISGEVLGLPADLIYSSASGLDPEISPAAAQFQVSRIAKARNVDLAKVQALIPQATKQRDWLVFGEPRVNVLQLNLLLDGLK